MLVLHIEKVWKSFRSEHLDKVGELRKLPDMRVSWAVLHHMVLILKVPKVAVVTDYKSGLTRTGKSP